MFDIITTRLHALPADRLAELVTESQQAGFGMVQRLVEEWDSGANRFAQPGEFLLAATAGSRIVGDCGLNRDPYVTPPGKLPGAGTGRVRRLYVLTAFRRLGVGRRLVEEVIAASRGVFHQLRLYTGTPDAAAFYERLGFHPCAEMAKCTHVMDVATCGSSH